MKSFSKYFKTNKSIWNLKTGIHEKSIFYDLEGFKKSGNSLNVIEEKLLGNVKNKSIIHLQCHFGMDSISLGRKGATVTAIDFSPKSIELANKLNREMDTSIQFIECNVYDTLEHVNSRFDIVFTSYGAICWLPDMPEWARVVDGLLNQGGKLILVEFHPTFYIFDFPNNKAGYDYFNNSVYEEISEGSYDEKKSGIRHKEYFWNHPLSDVIGSLLNQGLCLEVFEEFDFSPHDCFENMVERKKNEFVYRGVDVSIPHIYSIVMSKELDI